MAIKVKFVHMEHFQRIVGVPMKPSEKLTDATKTLPGDQIPRKSEHVKFRTQDGTVMSGTVDQVSWDYSDIADFDLSGEATVEVLFSPDTGGV